MCGRISCSLILRRWRLWIRPVLVTAYFLIIVIIVPLLIINSIHNGFSKRDQGALLGGAFVMMAVPIAIWQITQHIVYYTQPCLQKHIIRYFLCIVFIYSCCFFYRFLSTYKTLLIL